MPIRLRFLLVANAFLAALGVIGFLSISHVDRASDIFSRAAHESIDQVQISDQIRVNLPDLRALVLEYIMATSPEDGSNLLEAIRGRRQGLKQVMSHYNKEDPQLNTPTCQGCHDVFKGYIRSHDQMILLATQGHPGEAFQVYQASAMEYSTLLDQAEEFRQKRYASARADTLRGEALGEEARNMLIASFAAAALVTFVLGHTFSGYVNRRLGGLMEGTRRVISGDFSARIRLQGRDEFRELGDAFNGMTESLEAAQAENARLHEAAIKAREERIALLSDGLKRATEAQENERKRVARELHDEVGQALTGLQLGLGRLARATRSPRVRESAEALNELTVDTIKQVRNLALDLRPGLLEEIGLAATLRQYTRTLSGRIAIPIELAISNFNRRLSPELEITVFRVVQESLTNIARYAHATRAVVELGVEDGVLFVRVLDDGQGFDVEATRADYHHSLGISGMEERCRFSGGSFDIQSAPGQGTTVSCTWRLEPEPAQPGQESNAAGSRAGGPEPVTLEEG
jgi:signal transduction histidine kinase